MFTWRGGGGYMRFDWGSGGVERGRGDQKFYFVRVEWALQGLYGLRGGGGGTESNIEGFGVVYSGLWMVGESI